MKIEIIINEKVTPQGKQIADKIWAKKSPFLDELQEFFRKRLFELADIQLDEYEEAWLYNYEAFQGIGLLIDFDKTTYQRKTK